MLSNAAGELEPCGCIEDMLGGIDHASQVIADARRQGLPSLLVAAGPMLFPSTTLGAEMSEQARWKAETMALGLRRLGLWSWAPGANDYAAGLSSLDQLKGIAQAAPLDALSAYRGGRIQAARIANVGGTRVGVIGLTLEAQPEEHRFEEAARVLTQASFAAGQVDILIALLAMGRRDALRLAELTPEIDVVVNGMPSSDSTADDSPAEPELIGNAIVVTAPNHLRGLVVLDFTLVGRDRTFEEIGELRYASQRSRLQGRVADLERGLKRWSDAQSDVQESDLASRRQELLRAQQALRKLTPLEAPTGSHYRYSLREIRDDAGTDPRMAQLLGQYYARVNEHNRLSLADRRPPALKDGEPGYLGAALCVACHQDAGAFWKKSEHGSAYATLQAQHKEYNLDCVGCHVTGYEKPGGSTATFVDKLKDVQCESCHGPGSRHLQDLSDTSLLVVKPPATLCAQACHYPPHVQADWDPRKVWNEIIGPGHGLPLDD